jgi:hypothetical protein
MSGYLAMRREVDAIKCIVSLLFASMLIFSLALILGCGNQDEPIAFEPSELYGIDPSDRGLTSDGLVAYWPFNGNANDESGSSNHGTVYGASLTTDRCGRPNSAYSFDGEDDYIEVGHDPSLNVGTGDFTICCWLFMDQYPVIDVRIVGKFSRYRTGPIHADNYGYTLVVWSTGIARVGVGEAGTGEGVGSLEPLDTGRWIFLTGVRSGGVLSLYVDGEIQGSVGSSRNGDNEVTVEIGASKIDISDVRWFEGCLDDIRIYNRALSTDEIALLADPGCETEVAIDIKPGSFPNSINPRSQGVIPVAILTTSVADGDQLDFDATTVDPTSAGFGPDSAMDNDGVGQIEDVDGDGDMDLVLHFRTEDTGIDCGDTEADLTGETYSGEVIVGSDSIRTVGCGGKNGPPVAPH